MPRFFFHSVHNGLLDDGVGEEFASIDQAKRNAVVYASDLLKEVDGDVFHDDVSVDVTNDRGLLLFRVVISGIMSPGVPG